MTETIYHMRTEVRRSLDSFIIAQLLISWQARLGQCTSSALGIGGCEFT